MVWVKYTLKHIMDSTIESLYLIIRCTNNYAALFYYRESHRQRRRTKIDSGGCVEVSIRHGCVAILGQDSGVAEEFSRGFCLYCQLWHRTTVFSKTVWRSSKFIMVFRLLKMLPQILGLILSTAPSPTQMLKTDPQNKPVQTPTIG